MQTNLPQHAGAAELTGAHLTSKTNFYGKKLNSTDKSCGGTCSSAPRLWQHAITVYESELK